MRQFLSRLSRKTLMIGGIVLGVVLLTGVGLAAAAALHASAPNTALSASVSPTSQPTSVPGKHLHLVQVKAVNGNTITVVPAREVVKKGAKQTPVTLTISSSTKITKYGQPAQASAIQVDEFLAVKATDPQHVQQIAILGYGVRGTIQKISDGTLTLQTEQNQTVTVHVNSGAHIFVGHQPASLSDLQANETVEALGDKNSDGSLNAMLVHVDLIHGQVTSINGNKITLSTGNKGAQTTVTTSAATKYYVAGQPVPASTLQQGDTIGVAGPGSQQSGVTATAIFIHEPAAQGTVTGVNGDTITVKAKDGTTWTITVNSDTKYFQGKQPASLSAVQVNSKIRAVGLKTGDNALTAIVVRIAAPQK
jgi:preprotein translocase subunit YajC